MFPIQVASLEFLVLSIICLILWHLLFSRTWRLYILSFLSLPLIASYITAFSQIIVLAITVIAGFFIAKSLQKKPSRTLLSISLTGLGICFLMHKDVLFKGFLGETDPFQPAAIMGFSLVFFKLIHLFADAYGQTLRPLKPLTYFSWILAFFTWLAGPIVRYNDFAEQAEEGTLKPERGQILPALNRIVNGCFRLLLICPFILKHIDFTIFSSPQNNYVFCLNCFVYMYGYYLYIYMNFSGYCDIVLGLGMLFGIKIPENFTRPYLARNLLEYWRLWHITLSEWFRDYVFTPIYMSVSKKCGRKYWYISLIAAYALTFAGTGLWHGFTLNFLLFGMTHAVGCLFLRFSWHFISKKASKKFIASYKKSKIIACVACVCSNSWVAFSLLFFSRPLAELGQLLNMILTRLTA